MTTALLVIAHGSRNAEANGDLHHAVAQLRERGEYAVVEPAFLELAEPAIEDAGARCVATGVRRVILLPYFLSAGVHVREDLRAHRQRLAERFPDVSFVVAEPISRHPALIDIVAGRAREAERKMDT